MKTISFDVGIKNMAYCIFDCSSGIDILDWKVLNLNEENTVVKETFVIYKYLRIRWQIPHGSI